MSRPSRTLNVEARSLLELCHPPEGYTFVRGAWATHDLDMLAVSEYIAPALVGSVATERRQRRLEGRMSPEGKSRRLLIFPCIEKQTHRGLVPWCSVYPVGGRRQHAKFALLQFESERGGKVRTRFLILSANLTSSGVRRNRELLAWGEIGHLKTRGSIAGALLAEFRTLARDCKFQKECKQSLDEMADWVQAEEWPALRSSIRAPRPLLGRLEIKGPAKRVVVISPPFACDADDGPAELLSKYIGPRTKVEIYTGANFLQGRTPAASNGPEFSTSILNALRRRASAVEVHAVPELIPDADEPDEKPPMRRKLHAKLIALVGEQGDVHLLFGSANFTRSALEGRNRELMLYGECTTADLDAILAGLHAVSRPHSQVRPTQVVEERSQTEEPVPVRAVFWVDAAESPMRSSLRGRLVLTWEEQPKQIEYRGQLLQSIGEQGLWLSESNTSLKVTMADGRQADIPIDVRAPDDDASFWSRIKHEDDDLHPDTSWQHLLLDLRRGRRRATSNGNASVLPSLGPQSDGFYIPLEQRLVTLARYRHRLRVFAETGELEQQLHSYFDGQEEARLVACALIGEQLGLPIDRGDRLLLALRDAMRLFPAEEDAHA